MSMRTTVYSELCAGRVMLTMHNKKVQNPEYTMFLLVRFYSLSSLTLIEKGQEKIKLTKTRFFAEFDMLTSFDLE